MSREGHCRHCVDACSGGAVRGVKIPHEDGEGAEWTGKCPACVEAERVAVAIAFRRGLMTPDMMPVPTAIAVYLEALDDAAKIARGET